MSENLPPYETRGLGGEAAYIINPQPGEGVATGGNVARLPAPPIPHATEYVTATVDSPKVVAKERAIPLSIIVGVISLTGALAPVLPIDPEWLPAVAVILAAINAGAAYWYRTQVEGTKDQERAERV